jgi:hypothetical protein
VCGVLLRIYAKCLDGQDQVNKRRIQDAREPKRGDGGRKAGQSDD